MISINSSSIGLLIFLSCIGCSETRKSSIIYDTNPVHDQFSGFAISPDGEVLLIASPGLSANKLIKIDLARGTTDILHIADGENRLYDPAFAPDGNSFAAVICNFVGCSINIMDTNGRKLNQLSLSNQPVRHPIFSSNGRRLLYFAGANQPYGSYVNKYHLEPEVFGYYIAEYNFDTNLSSVFNYKVYEDGQKIFYIDGDNVAALTGLTMERRQISDSQSLWLSRQDYLKSIDYINNTRFSNAFKITRGANLSDWPLPWIVDSGLTRGSTLVGICPGNQFLIKNQNVTGHYDHFGQWTDNKTPNKPSTFLVCADKKSASMIKIESNEPFYDAAISFNRRYIITLSLSGENNSDKYRWVTQIDEYNVADGKKVKEVIISTYRNRQPSVVFQPIIGGKVQQ